MADYHDYDMNAEWERVISEVFNGDLQGALIDKATTVITAKKYLEGIYKGLGGNFSTVDYNTPDHGVLRNLERNVYQFAGAKNFQTLRALNDLLTDGEKVRTRGEFKKEARKALEKWNGYWLDAEYNTAINSAVNARKWGEFKQNAAIMPLLQFKIVKDEHTCPICVPFSDVVRPIDDPFWNYASPSLHFGDRCTILQLPDTSTPITEEVPGDEMIPKMFRVNIAKQQLAFPPDHPFYIGLPNRLNMEVMRAQRTEVKAWCKDNFAGKELPSVIGNIKVGMNGIKEAINQPHRDEWERNTALRSLDKLIKGATLSATADDAKGRLNKYFYLETIIDNRPNWIVVRENFKGEKHFYSIVDRIRPQ